VGLTSQTMFFSVPQRLTFQQCRLHFKCAMSPLNLGGFWLAVSVLSYASLQKKKFDWLNVWCL